MKSAPRPITRVPTEVRIALGSYRIRGDGENPRTSLEAFAGDRRPRLADAHGQHVPVAEEHVHAAVGILGLLAGLEVARGVNVEREPAVGVGIRSWAGLPSAGGHRSVKVK